ncbi:MAG: hypothetical protein GWP91_06080 [Rhodobacterales bacterium]|nr:hypothetical protein [Rhodobacterales bacterium]
MHRTLFALTFCALSTQAAQAKSPVDDCLRTKVWDTYPEGWSVRATSETQVEFGGTQFFKATLLKGRNYRVLTCAEEGVKDLDVLLYDKDGQVVERDQTQNREPMLSFSPDKTATYYIVLYLRDTHDKTKPAAAAWSLLHAD